MSTSNRSGKLSMDPAATARLRFRIWTDDDLPLARTLFGDPLVTSLVGGPFDDDQIRTRLTTEIRNQRDHGIQYWPIFLETNKHVGCCGLKPRAPNVPELGSICDRRTGAVGLPKRPRVA